MSVLDYLGKDALPYAMESEFVNWCVWEQARPALVSVLEKTVLSPLASEFQAVSDLATLVSLGQRAVEEVTQAHSDTGPLGLSAAKGAVFEFNNMLAAIPEPDFDPETVAFFAARVCGWAGWAAADFSQAERKAQAEEAARERQAAQLRQLWQKYGAKKP
jgi:hypothetical protein